MYLYFMSNIAEKGKIFESERFYELKYVIEIYHFIYILFISLNCMLLKQLSVVIYVLHASITIFDL